MFGQHHPLYNSSWIHNTYVKLNLSSKGHAQGSHLQTPLESNSFQLFLIPSRFTLSSCIVHLYPKFTYNPRPFIPKTPILASNYPRPQHPTKSDISTPTIYTRSFDFPFFLSQGLWPFPPNMQHNCFHNYFNTRFYHMLLPTKQTSHNHPACLWTHKHTHPSTINNSYQHN